MNASTLVQQHWSYRCAMLERSSNGRVEWKDSKGRTLKELQAQEASV